MTKEKAKVSAFSQKNLSMKVIMLLIQCKEKEPILLRMAASMKETCFKVKDMAMGFKKILKAQHIKGSGFKINNMD